MCLLQRLTHTLQSWPKGKPRPWYTGLFQVLERIAQVVYRLQLPEGTRLHHVHVGLLKPFRRDPPPTTPPVPPTHNGCLLPATKCVLHTQLHCDVWHILMQWRGMTRNDNTWEPLQSFKDIYPDVQLEDELFEAERCYDRCQRKRCTWLRCTPALEGHGLNLFHLIYFHSPPPPQIEIRSRLSC